MTPRGPFVSAIITAAVVVLHAAGVIPFSPVVGSALAALFVAGWACLYPPVRR